MFTILPRHLLTFLNPPLAGRILDTVKVFQLHPCNPVQIAASCKIVQERLTEPLPFFTIQQHYNMIQPTTELLRCFCQNWDRKTTLTERRHSLSFLFVVHVNVLGFFSPSKQLWSGSGKLVELHVGALRVNQRCTMWLRALILSRLIDTWLKRRQNLIVMFPQESIKPAYGQQGELLSLEKLSHR